MDTVNDAYTNLEGVINEVITILSTYALDVIGAFAILAIGVWLSGKVNVWLGKGMRKTKKVDETLITFFASMGRYIVLAVTVIAVLGQFGIQTASLLTVLGAAGLAIGLALQGTLSNVAAGVMLLLFRPFKVGDFITAGGHSGTVKALNLFFTEMATGDNVRITVPNSKIWGDSLSNFSANPTRRVDLTFGVSYNDDIDKAMDTIRSVYGEDTRVKSDPEPFLVVSNLGESSVDLLLRVWVDSGDYWGVRFDLTKAIKQRFDKNGISIPFPSRTVYHVGKAGE
ncbi:MAG: mechanosensitive ion channel [Rhodospirillales bacterium]|nr:mechanosensitive ion channel [Rhodospirillales bacterium]MCW8861401.1 mechanosensitive ion channel [Rhodospirillales bacterium]MCW8952917.1 mechanosensitive ion channel [Rhodospirillales bacterium]MCW8969962.1 mechanosensitive ion channel [Rhodospirillales bacterium]MCW9002736.1 mechanosensitive ion channel [Rhodospirillales bacterium]